MSVSPKISVILPTYNGARFIKATINGVINQSYKNLEIIIVDDCSKDDTVEIIKSFDDERIRFYQNEKNLGLADNTNRALSLATGDYIMMQDHDDVSNPQRAEIQLQTLLDNPDITGCGTGMMIIGAETGDIRFENYAGYKIKLDKRETKLGELFGVVAHHQTLMYDRKMLDKLAASSDKFYDNRHRVAVDQFFIEKLNNLHAEWAVLENTLLAYRQHGGNTSRRKNQVAKESFDIFKLKMKRIMPGASEIELELHAKILRRKTVITEGSDAVIDWFKKLIAVNSNGETFPNDQYMKILAGHFRSASILSNIYNPIRAYKTSRTFPEFKSYTKGFGSFLSEYQKRFFRNLSWLFSKKERL